MEKEKEKFDIPQKPPVNKKQRITLLLAALLGINAFFFGVFYLATEDTKPSVGNIAALRSPVSVSPTPFPFEELTIPYLRDQTYESELSQLNEVSNNDSYTGYLTSYES